MDTAFYEDQKFEGADYSEKRLTGSEFADCGFISCNFSKTDLGNVDFMDCYFKSCNFSLAVVENTGIKNVRFIDCKLMGVDFGRCNDFLFSACFENCQLDYCSFYRRKMKKASFLNCSLKEVDFTETDLSMAVLKNCDLLNATFVRSNLEKTDFRTATNYSFDPDMNKMKKARFSHSGIGGLLSKYDIEIEQ